MSAFPGFGFRDSRSRIALTGALLLTGASKVNLLLELSPWVSGCRSSKEGLIVRGWTVLYELVDVEDGVIGSVASLESLSRGIDRDVTT